MRLNFDKSNTCTNIQLINDCFPSVKSKGHSLTKIFSGTMKSKYASFTAEMGSERFVKSHYPKVWEAQIKARADGGLSGSYQWLRIAELIKLSQLFNFKNVAEFGTGTSTMIFSELVGVDGEVSAAEESEYWLKRTKDILSSDINKNIEFFSAKRRIVSYKNEPFVRYDLPEDFYKKEYDLIYVDGPTSKLQEGELETLSDDVPDKFNYTLAGLDADLILQNGIRPKIIAVDARRPSVRWLHQKWSNEYYFFLRSFYKPYAERNMNYLYHSVFIRKDLLDWCYKYFTLR